MSGERSGAGKLTSSLPELGFGGQGAGSILIRGKSRGASNMLETNKALCYDARS
jgi:hypothetical protein